MHAFPCRGYALALLVLLPWVASVEDVCVRWASLRLGSANLLHDARPNSMAVCLVPALTKEGVGEDGRLPQPGA